jgi:uncharacterized protein YhaN
MLTRISLIIAILAGLGAGSLTFTKVQDIITSTRTERDDWHKKDTDELAAHTKTKKTLADTKSTLDKTQKTLDTTKGELEAANGKVDELTKNNTDLTAKLEKTTGERDDAQQQLERWRNLPSPEEIRGVIADLDKTRKAKDALVGENKLLVSKVHEWESRWNNFFQNSEEVLLPTGLRGKVVAVDPKFNFVVLNIGEDQGARQRGVLMVDRDGKLLGKVRITSVTKDECVANILSDWKRGNIMEGDEVLY